METKKIYLYAENEGWKKFRYKNLSDIKRELAKREIEIGDNTVLGNNIVIANYVKIGKSAKIGDNTSIGQSCEIGDYTEIPNNSSINANIEIGNSLKIKRVLTISSSRHLITYWGENKIQIGCKGYAINEWLLHVENIGRSESYSEKEIAEYKDIIDTIAELHKKWKLE